MGSRIVPAFYRYRTSQTDPILLSQILLETARAEARVAILEILLAIIAGLWFGFADPVFRGIAWFTLLTVVPLLVDAAIRRGWSAKLRGF